MTQEWIPVTDKLPEREGRYLVTEKNKITCTVNGKRDMITYRQTLLGEYSPWNGLWYIPSNGKTSENVTAWMPGPKPYYDGDD